MNKRLVALAIITCLCFVRGSQCADLQVFEQPLLGSSEKTDTDYINVPLAHFLTPPQRRKVRSLRHKILRLERQSEELRLEAQATFNILKQREQEFEKAHSSLLNFRNCLRRRSRLDDFCRSKRYFRRHSRKCVQRESCGNAKKIARNRRDKLRLMEQSRLELAEIRKKFTRVKKKSQKLHENLAFIFNHERPRPSNKPRIPVEQHRS